MSTTHVVGVCGSLREESYTRLALARALGAAEDLGATTELLDLRAFELPPFDPDVPDSVAGDAEELTRRIREADAVILASPVYHGSYSSPLKTAIDYCGFDEFAEKTVGLLAVSGGSFPVIALEHMRSVCRALNAWVLPHEVGVPRSSAAFEDGAFVDEALANRVEKLGHRAVQYATIDPDPATFESEQNVGAKD